MNSKTQKTVLCQICRQPKKPGEVVPAELLRGPLVDAIRKSHPEWSTDGFICMTDLHHFRAAYVQGILEAEKGELSALEEQVMQSIKEQDLLSQDVNAEFEQRLTLGDRLSDRVAEVAGSWAFIMGFAAVLVVWIVVNSVVLLSRHFDPYPFILLNLVLSCIAAMQAPIIMMSQNRQEAKDRLRSEHDYRINLKAELEIRTLHEKIDHLLMHQWQRLLEIQDIQTQLMEEVSRRSRQRDDD